MKNADEAVFYAGTGGLTKRELFAAMAMQGYLAGVAETGKTPARAARYAVMCADALIEELDRKPTHEDPGHG